MFVQGKTWGFSERAAEGQAATYQLQQGRLSTKIILFINTVSIDKCAVFAILLQ